MWRRTALILGVVLFLLAPARPAAAYAVLTHEALIDTAWDRSIAPILVRRFHPSADALTRARAFAYGGCIFHDMGYYPLSSRTFSDLVHYVRAGDFVMALIRQARNADELAFALGALAHYTADTDGHAIAINPSTPLLFPKLEQKFGTVVTYEDSPSAHLRTEFAFDVVQVARGAYLPQSYRDFVGFQIATPLVERAFAETYGLELRDVFGNLDMAVGTFRWSVSQFLPALTKAAWETKQKDLAALEPAATKKAFLFTYSRADYERSWGHDYKRPGFRHRLLAFLIRIVPKVGPFKALAFKAPTPEAERLFLESFDTVARDYQRRLADVARGSLALAELNLDTGRPVRAGDYQMLDDTYAELLKRLDDTHFAQVTPPLRARILAFYAAVPGSGITSRASSRTTTIAPALAALRSLPSRRVPR